MDAWQWILALFFLLLPVMLMLDFWPEEERLSSRGIPLTRPWRRQFDHATESDEEHYGP